MNLFEHNAKHAQFRIMPRYKVKAEGDVVRIFSLFHLFIGIGVRAESAKRGCAPPFTKIVMLQLLLKMANFVIQMPKNHV